MVTERQMLQTDLYMVHVIGCRCHRKVVDDWCGKLRKLILGCADAMAAGGEDGTVRTPDDSEPRAIAG